MGRKCPASAVAPWVKRSRSATRQKNAAIIISEGCGPSLVGMPSSADNAAPARWFATLAPGRKIGRMHEIRLRCSRRKDLVSDRDRSRGRGRIRRYAPRRREVLSQGGRKGDTELPACLQGFLRAGDRPQSAYTARNAVIPDIARRRG